MRGISVDRSQLPASTIQRTKFSLFIDHTMDSLRLDIINCDFIRNTAHKGYLNIPVKHLCKKQIKDQIAFTNMRPRL